MVRPAGAFSPGNLYTGRASTAVRYRGFVLIPQADLTWLVQPERSPIKILAFRTPVSSLEGVKALVDWRLADAA
jgi:hypothetical protein